MICFEGNNNILEINSCSFIYCIDSYNSNFGIFNLKNFSNIFFNNICVEKCYSFNYLFCVSEFNNNFILNSSTFHSCPITPHSLILNAMYISSLNFELNYFNSSNFLTSCIFGDALFIDLFSFIISETGFNGNFINFDLYSDSHIIKTLLNINIIYLQYSNILNCTSDEDISLFCLSNNGIFSNLYFKYTKSPLISFL